METASIFFPADGCGMSDAGPLGEVMSRSRNAVGVHSSLATETVGDIWLVVGPEQDVKRL